MQAWPEKISMGHDIELTDVEVEYLTLKYLYEQKLQGRDNILTSEVYEYLGCGGDDISDADDTVLCINESGIARMMSLKKQLH
jgi:hypothetical protein